jgi:hypothetical protein
MTIQQKHSLFSYFRILHLISVCALLVTSCSPTQHLNSNEQLVGAQQAKWGAFPGVVYLPSVDCTAARVGTLQLLTAKHCVTGSLKAGNMISIATGSPVRASEAKETRIVAVDTHPTLDVAVVTLANDPWSIAPMSLTSFLLLASHQVVLVGYGCTERAESSMINGGLTSGTTGASPLGGSQNLSLRHNETAKPLWNLEGVLSKTMDNFLVFDGKMGINLTTTQPKGLCPGDSGGPLLVKEGNQLRIAGINLNYHPVGESKFARLDLGGIPLRSWLEARIATH